MIALAMLASLPMPPKAYDHPPKVIPQIMRVEPKWLPMICGSKLDKDYLMGCYMGPKRGMFLRNDLSPQAEAKVIRHEHGHANGWHHK